jgi:hypothetical protein
MDQQVLVIARSEVHHKVIMVVLALALITMVVAGAVVILPQVVTAQLL